jgi:gamma-glutamyl:cysteine ligase YbdK (ATP-grasp superfamily)
MEPIEMNELDQTQKIERVILDSQSVAVVKTVSDQISLELGDLVQVTQKLVSNFLIRKRSQPLTPQEMSEFLSENYDLVKALKHATQEVIKARQNGDQIEINDLLKFIQTPSVKSELAPKAKRGRKAKGEALKTSTEAVVGSDSLKLGELK